MVDEDVNVNKKINRNIKCAVDFKRLEAFSRKQHFVHKTPVCLRQPRFAEIRATNFFFLPTIIVQLNIAVHNKIFNSYNHTL